MSKDKYRLYFSPINTPLTVTQVVSTPTLALDLSDKWYHLYLVHPDAP